MFKYKNSLKYSIPNNYIINDISTSRIATFQSNIFKLAAKLIIVFVQTW